MNKHDKYVDELCVMLSDQYDFLETHVRLFKSCKAKKKRVVAEADVVAYKEDYCHVYEVKCSHRPTKARQQLEKIQVYLRRVKKTFFYCGESKAIIPIKSYKF